MSAATQAVPAPDAPAWTDEEDLCLARLIHELVRRVTPVGDLVVLETAPGGAAAVAAAIERARMAPVVATVAADATVLTRTCAATAARVVARYLTALGDVRTAASVEAARSVDAGAASASTEGER